MSGSTTAVNQPGVYGTLGTPAAGNIPGGRYDAVSWVDSGGDLWLFGGYGYDSEGSLGYLSDLWRFDPTSSEWTWMGGSSTANQAGVYGSLSIAAAGNIPGARSNAISWTDKSGDFWLFGGSGYGSAGTFAYLDDLWKFDPATGQWSWMGGSSSGNKAGVYGTLGTPASGNFPGGRYGAASWTDTDGRFWLFGGIGDNSQGTGTGLNDLWEFNPATSEWTWMSGSSTGDQPGVYGTLGTPAAGNTPGTRWGAASWTDSSGHLWLFGGSGYGSTTFISDLNDLWEFDPATSEWTWMAGSETGALGVYGKLGTPAAGNTPGSRILAASWTDSSGNLWLFGGTGYDSYGDDGNLNDLWEFTPPLFTAAPTFSPSGGTYASAQSVTISDATNGAMIYYTTDGSTPTTSSTEYTGPITVNSTETINAIAVASGGISSAVGKTTYTINLAAAATPMFSPVGGTYTSVQKVTISDATNGAMIYYTTDGSTPTTSSAEYTGAITINSSETIKAIATASGYSTSAVASATYTINQPEATPPVFTPAAGTYTSAQTVTISDSTPGATIYYTTNGTNPTTSSETYKSPIAVSATTTINAIAVASGYSDSAVSSVTYTIQGPQAATPTYSPAAGAYTSAQTVTISDSTSGAAIYYTTNDATPTTSSTMYSGPITVGSTETIKAIATATGYSTSAVGTAAYTINSPPPGFTLSASPTSVSVAQGGTGTTTITVTDAGGFSGAVALAATGLPSGVSASFADGSTAGTQVLTLTASTSAATTSSAATLTITGTSGSLSAITTVSLSITAEPGFAPGSGGTTSMTVTPGATTGNTGTISVAGTNGFSGTVNLTCSVTTTMTGVSYTPTCSLNPTSVTISGGTVQNSTLTVTTTASSSAENQKKNLIWPPAGGATLALLLLFLRPRRRNSLFALVGLLTLIVSTGLMACGGGGGAGGGGGGGTTSPGTTAGSYTITVTGTSGSTTATVATVALTVQ
ncbi:MAG TPA: chitobiase/beta-hexosaminidase C-terminal domain-containing protein [Terracidiphilus sp.]|nr:chitobiase/beta-hexosaminidase C-terminal domain-containing protein [Terracidiphilus sp.]